MALKVNRADVTAAVDAIKWTANGDDGEAAVETRKRARLTGPDNVAFLHFVVNTDKFASITQRVRAATALLAVGGFLLGEAKSTGLFDGDTDDDANGRAPS
jgi:hypothetical protein